MLQLVVLFDQAFHFIPELLYDLLLLIISR